MTKPEKNFNVQPYENWLEKNRLEMRKSKAYDKLLNQYYRIHTMIKRKERYVREHNVFDSELSLELKQLEKERHEIHMKLQESGHPIGKDKNAILADILTKEGNLSEYGLPDFPILQEKDLDYFDSSYLIRDNRVLIVFRSEDIELDESGDMHLDESDEYRRQVELANHIASDLKLDVFDQQNSRYFHEATIRLVGIIVPNDRIQEVATYIKKYKNA